MVDSGILLLKYWLEVSADEQTRRLESRMHDPRKIWKLSDMDLKSYSRWYDYSRARDAMFAATDTAWAPWYIANTDDKQRGRLNIISHVLSQIPYQPLAHPDVTLPKRQDPGDYVDIWPCGTFPPRSKRPAARIGRWSAVHGVHSPEKYEQDACPAGVLSALRAGRLVARTALVATKDAPRGMAAGDGNGADRGNGAPPAAGWGAARWSGFGWLGEGSAGPLRGATGAMAEKSRSTFVFS